jgi:DNA primase
MIAPATVQKIIDEARVDEVVGEFVSLKKRGANLIGNCPFHNEKTPSFYVSPSKGIYKCFGCGKAGGPVNFLMESQQMSYVESLRYLAQKYNVEIEEIQVTDEVREQINTKESILIALAYSQKYYTENLLNTDEGKSIGLSYFKERGFDEKTIEKFQLGYSLAQRDAFTTTALKNGYQLDILKKACLTSKVENSKYDFFSERVMFPIHDLMGRVIAYGARTLKSDKMLPKYINTADSEVYEKSKVLYGIFFAKHSIKKEDNCFLCEGYTDVISLHQGGIDNAVASSGTALTPEQIKLIKRFTDNITILYDGDSAGIKAALRGVDIAIEGGLNVKLALLPDGEDPDSFIRNQGAENFKDFIKKNQKDFILFKTSLFYDEAKSDPIKRAELTKDIVSTIAKIQEPFKRGEYIKDCSKILDVNEQVLFTEVNKLLRKNYKSAQEESFKNEQEQAKDEIDALQHEQQFRTSTAKSEIYEKDIVRLLVEYGSFIFEEDKSVTQIILEELDIDYFESEDYKTYFSYITSLFEKGNLPNQDELSSNEDAVIKQMTIHILFQPYEVSKNWEVKHKIVVPQKQMNYKKDVSQSISMFKIHVVNKLMKENEESLKNAENSNDHETQIKFMKRVKILQEEKRQLSKKLGIIIHAKN